MTVTIEPLTGYSAAVAADLPPAVPLHVVSSGAVTAAGIGSEALAELLAGNRSVHDVPPVDADEPFPPRPARTVPPFDAAALLGRKGTRNLDRLTRLGLIAAKEAIGAVPGGLPEDRRRTGVVVGTSTGSITTATDVGRDTLVQEKPYMVNPATFPNTVMNTCSGQIAIRHGLLGVNAALSGGLVSGLLAVRYARTALTQDRADVLVVGAVEEVTPRTAWAWHRTEVLHPEAPLGEAAAAVVLQRPGGSAPRAELLGCEVGYFGGSRVGPGAGLARCIAVALARSGVAPEEVDVVVPGSGALRTLAAVEEQAVTAVLGDGPSRLDIVPLLGECYSAATSVQLAAFLSADGGGRIGLVTAVGASGEVGALVVRIP